MATNNSISWAKVVQGQKRPVKGQLVSPTRTTKKGTFVPSEGWMKFVTSERVTEITG
ncbi:hypothetical protein DSO57_1010516 [Entomophthora muscae]|uniref:Uncharacterized protein n=1 Tax=Entomophthora muscae TaxID=34485 RepID=A0ACC2U529_9FUNG|nr:hypothetical protein DSO57_1010516 [Entomophthora muscae]